MVSLELACIQPTLSNGADFFCKMKFDDFLQLRLNGVVCRLHSYDMNNHGDNSVVSFVHYLLNINLV